MELDPKLLIDLVKMKMPFGKHKDTLLCDLPTYYLEWFARKGFPKGKLGMLMETMFVIRTNGLDDILNPIKEMYKNK